MAEARQPAPPRAKQTVGGIDAIVLALKASGGYKYRERIQLSGPELDVFVATAEARIRELYRHLQVAEKMMREPPPSSNHMPRWEEYLRRCKEAAGNQAK